MRFFNGAERGRFRRRVGVRRWLAVVVGAMCLSVGMARGAEGQERQTYDGESYAEGEIAVASALNWLFRHQDKQRRQLELRQIHKTSAAGDETCTGAGIAKSDAGATGMALLCFLGAGQTHKTKGPYRRTIELGLIWLIRHQKRDGNLAKGCHVAHVLARHCHPRLVRGVRHDRRPQDRRRRSIGRELHPCGPKGEGQRVAIFPRRSRRARRSVGGRLAGPGPAQRPIGRVDREQEGPRAGRRVARPAQEAGRRSRNRFDGPPVRAADDDRRPPTKPATSWASPPPTK